MKKILVIVESPGKIEKIQQILGNNYVVMASVGHIIDLDKRSMSVDIDNNFEPQYKIIEGKEGIIEKLRVAHNKAQYTLLASDEDREGEMIAWSLAYVLEIDRPKRIVFNSITHNAIIEAVNNPTSINQNLVNAQKLRRILDRIIGYKLSPLLWRTLGSKLSAGRVQSVVVRLIVEREEEIKQFFELDTPYHYKVVGEFSVKDIVLSKTQLYHNGEIAKIEKHNGAKSVMSKMTKSIFTVASTTTKNGTRKPSAPFTTSTLQQEAFNKMGFNPKRTMRAAQNLYEAGFITYMRTDSVSLSPEAMNKIEDYILNTYGEEYYNPVTYKSKSKNTQEAHEAIRPSDPKMKNIMEDGKIGNDEIKLYNLIWKRTIASQMAPAKIKTHTIMIDISKLPEYNFVSQTETVVFKGFLEVYGGEKTKEKYDIQNGTQLEPINITAAQVYQKPPSRYNDASLVNKLDPSNLNIGRPSTYATIIEKIQTTGYVVKQDHEGVSKDAVVITWDGNELVETVEPVIIGRDEGYFSPTHLGITVTNFLINNFAEIMDYKFTAKVEEQLDDVAMGKEMWNKVLKKFYQKFQSLIDRIDEVGVTEKGRVLGIHPETNEEIIVSEGRYGPILKMSKPGRKTPIIAPIKHINPDKITLEEAIEILSYPKDLGKYDRKKVTLNRGKYGYYIKIGKEKISIKPELINNPDEFSMDDVNAIMENIKKKALWEGKDGGVTYTVLEGPYGKYIRVTKNGKKSNVKLPQDIDLDTLEIETVKSIVEEATSKPKKKFRRWKKK